MQRALARFIPAAGRGSWRWLWSSPIPSHELREQIAALMHERPFQKVEFPCTVSSVTLTQKTPESRDGIRCPLRSPDESHPAEEAARSRAHLEALCRFFGAPPPPPGASFYSQGLGEGLQVRWERHAEMETYTFIRAAGAEEQASPFAPGSLALSAVPDAWLRAAPGSVISALHLAVLPHKSGAGPTDSDEAQFREAKRHLNTHAHVTAAAVHSGAFRLFSDWRVHGDGFARAVLYATDRGNRMAAGKVIQRLVELDKYRVMACMGLPLAQELAPRADRLSRDLQGVMEAVGAEAGEGGTQAARRRVMRDLCKIAADSLKLQAASSFRFSACAAYARIAEDRIWNLRLERIDGAPSVETAMLAALRPALRTCTSVAERIEAVTRKSQLTAELMQAALTVEQQAASAEQLGKIRETAQTQLRLQETVEGLSVVAMSYYALGVVGYAAKAAAVAGFLPAAVGGPEVVVGAAMPFVGLAVWRGIHATKASALGGHGHAAPDSEPGEGRPPAERR